MQQQRKILVIGGHGRVALRALPLLTNAGHEVHALVRDPAYEADIVALGATPRGAEMLAFDDQAWDDVIGEYDVVIWTAGNGGRQGPDQTYAIDRDAAIASIDAAARAENPPRYLMVSFATSLTHPVDQEDPFHHYVLAKRAADEHLMASGLDHAILGPGRLTDEDFPAGLRRVDPSAGDTAGETSRQLVAQVLAHLVDVETLPEDRFIAFSDGEDPVSSL
ncbi:NAD(P)H-binding protein [uncultured Tessaracoccus sp.]|uniref:NAD(P)H-binding protein n=1 Tax=uncultured Tessaracoccus sp. TaxID=905023 RepID=UPI0025D61099|nr:NAD(P)H-binding protein [uncultured Tessaracoccus sp.]